FAPAWARADPDWPRTPRALVAQLQRQSPALRDAGIVWGRRRTAEERLIDIWTVPRSAGPTGTPTGRPDD
ncbi:MAG TPA: hypothetical protein VIH37_06455, partial [Candidatus Limnocylindrales bacterium]